MNKKTRSVFFGFASLLVVFFLFLFVGKPPRAESMTWGVNFSQKHAINLGLDWKETYLALLDDLKVKHVKVAVHWDYIEGERPALFFEDVDWQVQEAAKRNAKLLLVIGMKTPRWPECHVPQWAKDLGKRDKEKAVLAMLEGIVSRYKDSQAVWGWQVENEPFFPFGECFFADIDFLKKEVNLVRSLDGRHPVVVSESGEGSFWTGAATYGDVVGITLYQKAWVSQLGISVDYPLPPVFYWRKAQLINTFFGKNVIGVELQAEPWGPSLLYDLSLKEQEKTMNPTLFREGMEFARQTGLDTFYLWGAEWWFWLKDQHDNPLMWEEAKKLLIEQESM